MAFAAPPMGASPNMLKAMGIKTKSSKVRETAARNSIESSSPPKNATADSNNGQKYNLRDVDDARRLTIDLRNHDRITFLRECRSASIERCWDELMLHLSENKKIEGVNGVATEQMYTRRLVEGSEFIAHKGNSLYEHAVIHLDDSTFDYATDLSVIVHLDADYTRGGLPATAEHDIEVILECCRFAVYSTSLKFSKQQDGKYVGQACLLSPPNLIPLRHTTWSSPTKIKIREFGRIVTQVDVHSYNVLANKLVEQVWFLTPAHLPVVVQKGIAMFNRNEFLMTVPEQFLSRYTSKSYRQVQEDGVEARKLPKLDPRKHFEIEQAASSHSSTSPEPNSEGLVADI